MTRMQEFKHYFANVGLLVKSLLKGEKIGRKTGNAFFSRVDVGICSSYCLFGVPFFTLQYNPNFRNKLYCFGVPLLTWGRAPLLPTQISHYQVEADRKERIYIHISGLPYFDNFSGIPRVAKKLSEEGLKRTDLEVLPVYPDPRDGTYRIALNWIRQKGYENPRWHQSGEQPPMSDPVMTIRKGDWMIHTMINPNELEFEHEALQTMRRQGVKVGFILHDIIAERHPDYFKKRDARNFARWLRKIGDFDGLFSVSRATLNDYLSWRQEEGLPALAFSPKWFHLGADFKEKESSLSEKDKSQLNQLLEKDYFLQVSTIEPRKGYRQLLDAFEVLWRRGEDLRVVFVGRKGWLVNGLCRRIKNHPQLNRKLFWFYGVSDEFLINLYKNAKAVIVASENEGFGLSVVEGAFYRKPLLLRDIPVFREVAGDEAFYFDGLDGESLALKIEEMVKNLENQPDNPPEIKVTSWSESFDSFQKLLK